MLIQGLNRDNKPKSAVSWLEHLDPVIGNTQHTFYAGEHYLQRRVEDS